MTALAALETRLGRKVEDHIRAEANLSDALVMANDLARQSWTWGTAPERVQAIVVRAAMRLYTNPDGLLTRQAGAFSTTKAAGIVPVGMFNEDEERTLRSYRAQGSNGLWTLETERGDLDGDSEYLTEVAYDLNNFAGTKPFHTSEDDPDWVPSLKRGIPQGDAPYRGRRGWF